MVKYTLPEEPGKGVPNCVVRHLNNDQTEPLPELAQDTVSEMVRTRRDLLQDMKPFWEGYRKHFAAFGINLCSLLRSQLWALPQWETAAAPYPFAFCCAHERQDGPVPLDTCSRALFPRFAYAQDANRLDLVIKLTDKNSMEYKIYRYLADCSSLYDSGDSESAGVLPPTAILDSPYQFSFVVMPMWGVKVHLEEFDTVRQVTTFIRCTLSGLSYLHRHRIVHRDIDKTNMMINWYCSHVETCTCAQRLREHSRSSAVAYALFDFDLSLQFPPETPLASCRRPAEEAFTGKQIYHPPDVYQGERHYNPFAFDVACLGRLYLAWFKDTIPVVPLLAPMIGKMTTHIPEDRWSAEEAFTFFNEILTGLSPGVLESSVTCQLDLELLDDPALYWNELSPEFQRKWNTHRPPPLSWMTRILRWVNTTDSGWVVVPRVRRYLQI